MYPKEIILEGVNWINSDRDREQGRAFIQTLGVLNLRVSQVGRISCAAKRMQA
jgi:hypothetical protein